MERQHDGPTAGQHVGGEDEQDGAGRDEPDEQDGGLRAPGRDAFLRGHEEPELFIKEPNARRVGGGPVDPMDGNFENDSIDYKVRHVLGVSRIDPKATVASNGSGS